MSEERTFTLDEANGLVPMIQMQMDAGRAARDELVASAEEISERASRNGGASTPPTGQDAQVALAAAIGSITDLGVILRDLDSGLVDFPFDRGGDVVYLCWKSGEAKVDHWHPVDTGFGGRRPIEDL